MCIGEELQRRGALTLCLHKVRRFLVSHLACPEVRASAVLLGAAFMLVSCSSEPPSAADSDRSGAHAQTTGAMPIKSEIGLASYYSRRFDGKTTASGQTFSNDEFVAAHASLPLGTLVRITNLDTDVSAELQIIDRGPSKQNRREGVIIDVSQAAARKLQMKKVGRVKVRLEVLKLGDDMHQPLQKVTEKQKARK